jgi:hypothetical protein
MLWPLLREGNPKLKASSRLPRSRDNAGFGLPNFPEISLFHALPLVPDFPPMHYVAALRSLMVPAAISPVRIR